MRYTLYAAALAVTVPSVAAAQGWEIRAGLESASATVCSENGDCFGIQCSAAEGWDTGWYAAFLPQSDAVAADPILAIRMDGARYALTGLQAARTPGAFTGTVGAGEQNLLDALQTGNEIVVDPGRDFAVATFTLRGSRWAIGEVLALCDAGGPPDAAPAGDDQ